MKKVITYVAYDQTEFKDEESCKEYEEKIKEKTKTIKRKGIKNIMSKWDDCFIIYCQENDEPTGKTLYCCFNDEIGYFPSENMDDAEFIFGKRKVLALRDILKSAYYKEFKAKIFHADKVTLSYTPTVM